MISTIVLMISLFLIFLMTAVVGKAMIREEEFLNAQYGEEYRQYIKRVNRYITF
jgi:protein-S-isoprenylcysteine O-methyltransferase Ste14